MALRQDHQRGPLRGRGARPRVPTMPPAPAFQGTSVPVHTVSGVPARSSLSDPGRREDPALLPPRVATPRPLPSSGPSFVLTCTHTRTRTHAPLEGSEATRHRCALPRTASSAAARWAAAACLLETTIPQCLPPNLLASAWLFPQGLLRGLWCPWSKGPAEDERRRGEA